MISLWFLFILMSIVLFGAGFLAGMSGKTKVRQKEKLSFLRPSARKALKDRTQKRKDRIMRVAEKQGRITNDDVEDMFCISDTTAGRYLGLLKEEGKITQHGTSGRGVYYTPRQS